MYVASGWQAEHAAVFTAELRRALITDSERGVFDVGCASRHQAPRFKKTELFLILKRSHRSDSFELTMKC